MPLFQSGRAPSELSRTPVYTPSATPITMLVIPMTRTMSRLAWSVRDTRSTAWLRSSRTTGGRTSHVSTSTG